MANLIKMAVVPFQSRQVIGPKSHTFYNFNPWAMVEEIDVKDMMSYFVRKGCACHGNQTEQPLFATEEQIKSGQVVPDWS